MSGTADIYGKSECGCDFCKKSAVYVGGMSFERDIPFFVETWNDLAENKKNETSYSIILSIITCEKLKNCTMMNSGLSK